MFCAEFKIWNPRARRSNWTRVGRGDRGCFSTRQEAERAIRPIREAGSETRVVGDTTLAGYRSPRTGRCSCGSWQERRSPYARFADHLTCRHGSSVTHASVLPVESDGIHGYVAYAQVGRRSKRLVGHFETQTRARHMAKRAACLWEK